MNIMDLTRTDIDQMSDDELQERLMGDKTFAAAIELSEHMRLRDRQDADTMARRERRVVARTRALHTDEGPISVREFVGKDESGELIVTDIGHDAIVLTDFHEAHALALRAQHEIGNGFWRAVATRSLASPSWNRLTDSRATLTM
jgi:hypothetical protein